MSRDMVHYMRKLNTFCDTLSSQIRHRNEPSGLEPSHRFACSSYACDFVRMLHEGMRLRKGRMLCKGMILREEHAMPGGDAAPGDSDM